MEILEGTSYIVWLALERIANIVWGAAAKQTITETKGSKSCLRWRPRMRAARVSSSTSMRGVLAVVAWGITRVRG
jgi:hypothetical protein